jgi:hypothetical protein
MPTILPLYVFPTVSTTASLPTQVIEGSVIIIAKFLPVCAHEPDVGKAYEKADVVNPENKRSAGMRALMYFIYSPCCSLRSAN